MAGRGSKLLCRCELSDFSPKSSPVRRSIHAWIITRRTAQFIVRRQISLFIRHYTSDVFQARKNKKAARSRNCAPGPESQSGLNLLFLLNFFQVTLKSTVINTVKNKSVSFWGRFFRSGAGHQLMPAASVLTSSMPGCCPARRSGAAGQQLDMPFLL